jgi:hypothetical protein
MLIKADPWQQGKSMSIHGHGGIPDLANRRCELRWGYALLAALTLIRWAPYVGGAEAPASTDAPRRILQVGPGRQYRTPAAAAAIARDGDLVEIDAATYLADVAVWDQNDLTLKGVGGRPHMNAADLTAQGKGTWVISGRNVRVENIEFSHSRAPDANGAGIRLDGGSLVVVGCSFHDNQNGILTASAPDIELTIEHSEFANNGAGDGQSHNIYVGRVRSLVMSGSYSHHALVGHLLKSRARSNVILDNRLADERDGRASLAIDLAEGGNALIMGNIIQQGPLAENGTLLSYGAEAANRPTESQVFVINNTFVNDRDGGLFIRNATPATLQLYNNIFAGAGEILSGSAATGANLVARELSAWDRIQNRVFGSAHMFGGAVGAESNLVVSDAAFVDRARLDYRLQPSSAAIDRGMRLIRSETYALVPQQQYVNQANEEPRRIVGRIDIGAWEFPAVVSEAGLPH